MAKNDSSRAKPLPLREQQKLFTQERLLDASVHVFLERGYANSTVDDIVEAASVGRATFYLHFKNKLEVMRALIQAMERHNEDLIEELRSYDQPTRATLESWLRRFVNHWFEEGDRFLVGLQALASEPELSGELEVGIRLATGALSKLLVGKQAMSVTEAQLRANLLVGALQQACRALVSEPQHYSVDLVVRVITEIWANNLGI
ncbi:UNVERIFIED_ORG: TetR family transcriptional regulator [Burkholderia sp. CF145]